MVKWLNVMGLICGMLGVVFIFIWGPPQPSFEQGMPLGLEDATRLPSGKTVAEFNAETAAAKQRYALMSNIGLALIFVGFGCQMVASWPRG